MAESRFFKLEKDLKEEKARSKDLMEQKTSELQAENMRLRKLIDDQRKAHDNVLGGLKGYFLKVERERDDALRPDCGGWDLAFLVPTADAF